MDEQNLLIAAMIHAYKNAQWSPDPSSQNGSVLVDSKSLEIISHGWNRFPDGVKSTPERLANREEKYPRINHAERVALYSAARSGVATMGTTLVCPWLACTDCAKAIIDCGVRRVVSHKQRMDIDAKNWGPSITIALEMMQEAGIVHDQVDQVLGIEFDILVSGQLWKP